MMTSSTIFIAILCLIFAKDQLVHCFKVSDFVENVPDDTFDNAYDEKQPIFVQVLYRHGDRNIVDSYPNDPYKNESLWPGGFGQLTNIGKQQQYELGKYIRRRYKNLLGKKYSWNEVFIRSTDMDRTLMSAQCNLAGMYPPIGSEVWKSGFNWQPIPIHTTPLDDDYVLNPVFTCRRRDFLIDEYFAEILLDHQSLKDFLELHSGYENMTYMSILLLYDTLNVENLKGLALPKWTGEVREQLYYLATLFYESYTHSTELKKIDTGFLIKEILDRFKYKTQSLLKPDRKMWIYSAHDLNIANILNALGVFEPHIPSYASSVYFELYKRGTEYYVQFFYRNKNEEKFPPLEIPNCGTLCPLDKFYELYKDILPTGSESYKSLCKL